MSVAPSTFNSFIDLETSLIETIVLSWQREWAPLGDKITKAVKAEDYDTAHDLADSIDTQALVARNLKRLSTFGKASMLLGAKSLTPDIRKTAPYNTPRNDLLDNAMGQIEGMLGENTTQALRAQAHREILKSQKEKQEDEDLKLISKTGAVLSADQRTRVKIAVAGKSFFGLGSSVHLNRMHSLGFLQEAVSKSVTMYTITAVLDSRTSAICKEMDGKSFTVESGYRQMENSLSSPEMNALKTIQPWPSQSKASISAIAGKSSGELSEAGLALPPYHPLCRTIITEGGVSEETDSISPTFSRQQESIISSLTTGAITAALFGDLSDAEEQDIISDDVVFEDSFQSTP